MARTKRKQATQTQAADGTAATAAPARRKRARIHGPPAERVKQVYEEMADARRIRSTRLDANMKAMVMHVYNGLRAVELEYLVKRGRPRRRPKDYYRAQTCKLCGITTRVFNRILKEWNFPPAPESKQPTFAPAPKPKTRNNRKERVRPVGPAIEVIRASAWKAHKDHACWSASDATLALSEAGFLDPPLSDAAHVHTKEFQSAVRTVRRFMVRHGWVQGHKASKYKHAMREAVIVARNIYLEQMQTNRNMPVGERMRIVCLDESYLHKHLHYRNYTWCVSVVPCNCACTSIPKPDYTLAFATVAVQV